MYRLSKTVPTAKHLIVIFFTLSLSDHIRVEHLNKSSSPGSLEIRLANASVEGRATIIKVTIASQHVQAVHMVFFIPIAGTICSVKLVIYRNVVNAGFFGCAVNGAEFSEHVFVLLDAGDGF